MIICLLECHHRAIWSNKKYQHLMVYVMISVDFQIEVSVCIARPILLLMSSECAFNEYNCNSFSHTFELDQMPF